MSVYPIKNHDIDLSLFNAEKFWYHETNFQVYSEYVSPHSYNIVVRRIDCNDRWDENIQILVHNKMEDVAETMTMGSSPFSEKKLSVFTSYIVEPDDYPVEILPRYSLIGIDDPKAISREEFNKIFETDIVVLPTNLYATGLKNGQFFIYNESYMHFYNIIYGIKFIMRVAKSFTKFDNFYFIISSCDGNNETLYFSPNRSIPKIIGETECKDVFVYHNLTDEEYPVFHKNKYILGQSNHKGMPYTLDIIDKHYLYHNYYNPFRSYSCGIPFHHKQSKIVFAAQDRGHKENWITRRDIELKPRDYFKEFIAPKYSHILHYTGGWIDRKDMAMNYKYQLIISGQSAVWDKLIWNLNSGSVILSHKCFWRQWFYDEYTIPNKYFIEIKEDFSDIEEQFNFCEQNPDICLKMIENCKKLFQEIVNIQNVFKHTISVIEKLNQKEVQGEALNLFGSMT